MSNPTANNNAAPAPSNNPFDIFIVGLKKGLNIGLYSLLPNVLMAFVLTYILQLWGVMDFLGHTCGGLMGVFGLPGEAITVLLATWLSCCLLYTSPSPRDYAASRMPSSA